MSVEDEVEDVLAENGVSFAESQMKEHVFKPPLNLSNFCGPWLRSRSYLATLYTPETGRKYVI